MRSSAPSPCPPIQLGTQTLQLVLAGRIGAGLPDPEPAQLPNSVAPQFGVGYPCQGWDRSGHRNAGCAGSQGWEGVTLRTQGAPVALPPTRTVLLWITFSSHQTRSWGCCSPCTPRSCSCPTARCAPQGPVPPPCPVPNFPTAAQPPSAPGGPISCWGLCFPPGPPRIPGGCGAPRPSG